MLPALVDSFVFAVAKAGGYEADDFLSLHQWPFYPGSGSPSEQGHTLVNIPLAAGTDDAAT